MVGVWGWATGAGGALLRENTGIRKRSDDDENEEGTWRCSQVSVSRKGKFVVQR